MRGGGGGEATEGIGGSCARFFFVYLFFSSSLHMSLSSSIYNEGTQLKKRKDTNSMAYWKKSSALRSSRLRERQRHKLYLRWSFF